MYADLEHPIPMAVLIPKSVHLDYAVKIFTVGLRRGDITVKHARQIQQILDKFSRRYNSGMRKNRRAEKAPVKKGK